MVKVLLRRHDSCFIVASVERVDGICRDSDTCCVRRLSLACGGRAVAAAEGQRQVREWLEADSLEMTVIGGCLLLLRSEGLHGFDRGGAAGGDEAGYDRGKE
jgi:hypothetical protein